MTDRIDLDERTDDEQPAEDGHPDDWIWRDDADPVTGDSGTESAAGSPAESGSASQSGSDGEPTHRETDDAEADGPSGDTRSIPHVPHPNKGKPAGIPVEGGGSGGGSARGAGQGAAPGRQDGPATGEDEVTPEDVSASGPHGGGADDMTMAFTLAAIQRVSNPAAVLADAAGWTDWIGIVGDVDAHVINKFQRDHSLDVDFFNGTGTGPGERLADIGPHSMFYADRMVVVGIAGRDEAMADTADWEFVPLETAAANAEWALDDT